MKSKEFEKALLFDYYGGLLTEKQRTCFDLYYNQDLSLSEIAEQAGISRQGVHDTIARAETQLEEFEQQIGAIEADRKVHRAASAICAAAEKLCQIPGAEALAEEILSSAKEIKE